MATYLRPPTHATQRVTATAVAREHLSRRERTRRAQLGSVARELAAALALERRRNAALRSEVTRLRSELTALRGLGPDAAGTRVASD